MIKNIGIIGLGTVGKEVIIALRRQAGLIKDRTGIQFKIKTVCDASPSKRKLAEKYGLKFTTKSENLINDPQIDIIVEGSPDLDHFPGRQGHELLQRWYVPDCSQLLVGMYQKRRVKIYEKLCIFL